MEYKDYYQILGVNKNATKKEIKKAYRRLASQYHPDRNQSPTAEDKLKEINEAYEVLGDENKRATYDRLGRHYHRFGNRAGNVNYDQVNLDDLSELFGGAGGFSDFFASIFGNGAAQQPAAQPLRRDRQTEVEITLEEAYQGTSRVLVDADGNRFTAKIPAGVRSGTRVRMRGKGSDGGDLYVTVNIRPHELYQTIEDSNDLRTTVKTPLLTAVLGGKVRVETLKGTVSLKIMPGTQGGQTLRLRGRGMPDVHRSGRFGDLFAKIEIEIPTQLSERERQLYEQLRAFDEPNEQ